MRKPIVILGGMGPQASLRFQDLLIRKSEAYHNGNGDEYPYIVHFSLPVTDFISDENAKNDAVLTIKQLTPAIDALEPQQITLSCNTAHLLIPDVPILQSMPFVSLIQTAVQTIASDNLTTVGLLGSPTTIRTKLYEDALHKKGIATVLPDRAQQAVIEQCIRAVIADTTVEPTALLAIARTLVEKGAQAIVLGCTELPLIFPKEQLRVPCYDTLELYAQAVIDRYYSV